MKEYQQLFKKFLGVSCIWVFALGISVGLFAGCGDEGMNFAPADSNPQGELLSNPQAGSLAYESAPVEFLFVPKSSSAMDFSSLESYARGTLDSMLDLGNYDAIPLDANGSIDFEFVPEDGKEQYLSNTNQSSAGGGICTYTRCKTFSHSCGNWLTGYYGCCTEHETVSVSCNVW